MSLNLQPRGENGRLNNVHSGEIDVLPADFCPIFDFLYFYGRFYGMCLNYGRNLEKKKNQRDFMSNNDSISDGDFPGLCETD